MWVPGQPLFFKGHEGPNVERIQYGVVEKALDSDSEELDFHPRSATVVCVCVGGDSSVSWQLCTF